MDPFELANATIHVGEWAKTLITHKPNVRTQLPESAPPMANRVVPSYTKHVFTPMKPPKKWKGRVSDTFDLKQTTVDKCIITAATSERTVEPCVSLSRHAVQSYKPVGCRWSNNSCAYNVTVYILYNMWHVASQDHKSAIHNFNNPWLNMMMTSFARHIDGQYTLEEVRDYFRRCLNREHPDSFIFGRETSVEAVMMKWCRGGYTVHQI